MKNVCSHLDLTDKFLLRSKSKIYLANMEQGKTVECVFYSLIQNFGAIERIYKMSFSKPTGNEINNEFLLNNYIELFKTIPAYFMAIFLFLSIRRLKYDNKKAH